jgi:hypothetical protein
MRELPAIGTELAFLSQEIISNAESDDRAAKFSLRPRDHKFRGGGNTGMGVELLAAA